MSQEKRNPAAGPGLGVSNALAGGAYDSDSITSAPSVQEATLQTIAGQYHALGVNVIPTADDKKPAKVGAGRLPWDQWQETRQTAEDLAGLPWSAAPGLAAICGPVSGALVCIDFDGGQDLGPVRAVLGALGLPADYAWTVRTMSGAHHIWVRCPSLELPSGTGKEDRPARAGYDHVELRFTGHYALLPPSMAGRYSYLAGNLPELAPAEVTPAALLMAYDLVTVASAPKAAKTATSAPRVTTAPTGRYTAYAQKALDDELDDLARTTKGQRNDQLNKACFSLGQLVGAGLLDRADVESQLEATALAIGLDERETLATMRSGLDAGESAPRQVDLTAPAAASSHSPDLEHGAPGSNGTDPATQDPTRRFRLTDFGNAERLAHHAGQDLRYCHDWARWLVWTGQRWEIDRAGLIRRRAKKAIRQIYAEAASVADEEARKEIAKWAMRSEAKTRVDAMTDLAQSEQGIPVVTEELDANPWLLNVANGALDLRTGQLRPHRREDLCTKQTPTGYDPGARCPTWLAFLDTIMAGNRDMIEFLQRAIGYSLTGLVSEQVLFFAHGTGANGKSTFTEALAAMLGDYAQKAPRGLLTMKPSGAEGVPNDVARLPGARFVVSNEVDEGRRLAEAQVKDLTGGDTLTARFMRGEFFEFKPTHKLWIYGNHKPVVRGTDEGIWRRIRLIPFEVTIPGDKQDPKLPDKLRAELPGILAWAVQGCLEWQRAGLGTPAEVKAATEAYRAEMDVIAEFLADSCVMTPNAEVTLGALYDAYKPWCESSGERALSKIAFGRRLKERGIEQGTSGRMKDRVWLGVGLLAKEGADNADNRGQFFQDSTKQNALRSAYTEIPAALVRVVREEDDSDFEEGEL